LAIQIIRSSPRHFLTHTWKSIQVSVKKNLSIHTNYKNTMKLQIKPAIPHSNTSHSIAGRARRHAVVWHLPLGGVDLARDCAGQFTVIGLRMRKMRSGTRDMGLATRRLHCAHAIGKGQRFLWPQTGDDSARRELWTHPRSTKLCRIVGPQALKSGPSVSIKQSNGVRFFSDSVSIFQLSLQRRGSGISRYFR
jgi:hypothetical protein